ncbi:prolyl 4-hydroxylase subunit alpha-3 isoform X2 [Phyllobates terribilis]|uniref:prolyl 4-hydroxylase subunit alpha-3 isoform X2 n=1 Tax=Phyllobates terribilis TaxID=111132 RepID=UPI003CCAD529
MCPGLWIVLFFSLGPLEVTSGDMYSSMVGVQQALDTEKVLVQLLGDYLEEETFRLNDLRRFYDKVKTLHHTAGTPVSDPIFAFTLLKRLQSEWMNVVHSAEIDENIRVLKDGYEKVEKKLPEVKDVEGAAKALMRLQDVYSLNVKGLTQGVFQSGPSSHLSLLYKPDQVYSMSADDCFHIGKIAYDMEDFYHSIPWLEEAVSKFRDSYGSWFTEDQGSLGDALDYLAFSYYKAGNVSRALYLSRECLLYDPYNMRMALNVAKYEKILDETPAREIVEEPNLLRPNVTHLRTRDLYEGLCQTLGTQLQRSVVASGAAQEQAEYRISKSAWLKDTVHPILGNLDVRIAAATGLRAKAPYAEYLQVVNYGIGGHYEPHFDHATSQKSPVYRTNTGNRIATFMIYLSSVDLGGSTAFIYANFSTPVVKNAAIFWWNLQRSGDGNEDTLHAGCPVLLGSKWVANKWIHECGQEFNRPCGLNPGD